MTVDPLVYKLVLGATVVGLGAVLQGTVGFGLALFSAPLLALIEPRLVPGPLIFAGVSLTLLMAVRERSDIDRRAAFALLGRVPGTIAGATTLVLAPAHALGVILGMLVLAAVGMTAVGPPLRPGPRTLLVAGLLSGFMGTTSSIGGPPIAMVYQHESGPRVRATLGAYFTLGATMSLIALAIVGRFGGWELRAALALLPGIFLGFYVSRRTSTWLDRGRTRAAVLVVSAAAGLALVVRELF